MTVLVALFIGLMVVVVQLDRLRRDRAHQHEQTQGLFQSFVQAVQGAQSRSEAVLQENVLRVVACVESLGKQLSEKIETASQETQRIDQSIGQSQLERTEWMTNRLREALGSGFKLTSESSESLGSLLSEKIGKEAEYIQRSQSALEAQGGKIIKAIHESGEQVTDELKEGTKAIVDLKASLEESVNFERR